MNGPAAAQPARAREAADSYSRSVADGPSDEIGRAEALLEAATITLRRVRLAKALS